MIRHAMHSLISISTQVAMLYCVLFLASWTTIMNKIICFTVIFKDNKNRNLHLYLNLQYVFPGWLQVLQKPDQAMVVHKNKLGLQGIHKL
jgi:hypothetical protein